MKNVAITSHRFLFLHDFVISRVGVINELIENAIIRVRAAND